MRELFSTGCVSCRKKMLNEICEASLGKCAPRQMRKLGVSCAQARAHRGSAIPRLAAGERMDFSPQLAQWDVKKSRRRRSDGIGRVDVLGLESVLNRKK